MRLRVLGSGSSGNATLVEAGGTRILLDAGLGPRELAERLRDAGVDPASLAAVLLSHEHGDHAKGAASFSRKWGVPLAGTRGTHAALGLGAAKIAGYERLEPNAVHRIGGLGVAAVPVPHDAAAPLAFVVTCGGLAIGHATDLGHVDARLVQAFDACQAVLIESNYDAAMLRDGPYPWPLKERILGSLGHLSNGDVGHYLAAALPAACETVVLAHLSEKNNHPELVRMTAEAALARAGRRDVRLTICEREGTGWVAVGPARRPRPQMRLF